MRLAPAPFSSLRYHTTSLIKLNKNSKDQNKILQKWKISKLSFSYLLPHLFWVWPILLLSSCSWGGWSNLSGSARPEPGHLAYIGSDGNLYVVAGELNEHVQITTDATTAIGTLGRSYHRIAWSSENLLAFAAVERRPDQSARSELYITEVDGYDGEDSVGSRNFALVGESDSNFVIYTYWRPGSESCTKPACAELVYLIEEEEEIVLRYVRPVPTDPTTVLNTPIGRAWPFYFSWAPNGETILWHQNGGRLDASNATYGVHSVESEQTGPLAIRPGLLLAPAYSPANPDHFALVNGENELILVEGAEQTVIVSGAAGDIAFAWSPNGGHLAYAVRNRLYDPFYQSIWTYDLTDRSTEQMIDVGLRPVGFFWAPDSTKLGYLQRMEVGNDEWYQWRVVEIDSLADVGFKPFNPTPQMRFVVSSFGQYAQSHRLWSPDSRHLIYFERSREGVDKIWRIDTTADDDGREPEWVADGSLAFYSWR